MDIAITVEGQRGLTWEKWKRFSLAVESLGFAGLYRSDHFVDAQPPDKASLELWVSLTWLADHTERIKFGPLVTPFSFRHPVHTARMAKDLNQLSGGRFLLGLGAGWGGATREHQMFGFDLLSVKDRFERFEEGIEIVTKLLRNKTPQSFAGKYFKLVDALFYPHTELAANIPLLVGGNGPRRILPLAARFADEWNAIYRTPTQFSKLNKQLDRLLENQGRSKDEVKRSQMMGLIYSIDQQDLIRKLNGKTVDAYWQGGVATGCTEQIIDQITELEAVGVEQIVFQWPDVDDLDLLEHFAKHILPEVSDSV